MNFLSRLINCCTLTSEIGIGPMLDNYLNVYSSIKNTNIMSYHLLRYFCNPITKSESILIEVNRIGTIKIKVNKKSNTFSIHENGKTICSDKHVDW